MNIRLTDEEKKSYWLTLPVGEMNAFSYDTLQVIWQCNERKVRSILSELSRYESEDGYILIRSAKGRGFYLTKDEDTIRRYKQECLSRGLSCLAPIKQINRFIKDSQDLKDYALKSLFDAIDQEAGMADSK